MKFEINTKLAKEYIKKASALVPNFSELPENSGVLITVFDTKVELKAKNSYVSIKLETNDLNSMKITETGSLLIKGKVLYEIISKMQGETIEFSKIGENMLVIKSNDSEYEVNLLDIENYIEDTIEYSVVDGDELVIDSARLIEAINKTSIAVPEKHQRKILQGINVSVSEGKVRFIGTEGIRIQKFEVESQAANMDNTINIKTAKELVKILPESGQVMLKFKDGTLTVKAGNTAIRGRLLEGAYPSVMKPFAIENTKQLVIPREEILSIIDRSTVMNANKQSETAILKMIIANDTLRFESRELETGYANIKTKNFKFNSDEIFQISFNPRFMIEAIKTTQGEAVQISMESPILPMIIKGNDSKELESLVLPFKTS